MSHSSDPNLRGTRAWPFEEAAKVADRLAASGKGSALFETGYGPSGLPHIGTFGEVARTTWVRRTIARSRREKMTASRQFTRFRRKTRSIRSQGNYVGEGEPDNGLFCKTPSPWWGRAGVRGLIGYHPEMECYRRFVTRSAWRK